jgi:hypothetical protein
MKLFAMCLFIGLLLGAEGAGRCETLTLETYYPSPVGAYTNLTVTSSTVLGRDGGNVSVGTAAHPVKLDVSGVIVPGKFSEDPADLPQKANGALYYNTTMKKYRVYDSGQWKNMSGGTPMDAVVTASGEPWTGGEYCAPVCTLGSGLGATAITACMRATAAGQIQTMLKGTRSLSGSAVTILAAWTNGFAKWVSGSAITYSAYFNSLQGGECNCSGGTIHTGLGDSSVAPSHTGFALAPNN